MLIPALFVADAAKAYQSTSSHKFDVIVFTEPADVNEGHRAWMRERGIIHCDDMDVSDLRAGVVLQKRLTAATLMKLRLAEYLAGRYDKIFYLDADVTIHDDVSNIFSLDTGEFALAAVPSGRRWPSWLAAERLKFIEHVRALGMTEPYGFVNSGVLFIDVEKWNRDEIGPRTLSFIRRNAELCYLPDEHGLNAVLDGRVTELSPLWNLAPSFWHSSTLRGAMSPVIIHYTGSDKPWKKFGYAKRLFYHRDAFRLYETFLEGSPWPNWLDDQWTYRDLHDNLVYELRLITRRLRRKPSLPPTRRQRRLNDEDFWRYCQETRFADLDQGIIVRDGAQLRLNKCLTVAK
jgi:lipopolysaccharide biosynthesis glycosyltransferase